MVLTEICTTADASLLTPHLNSRDKVDEAGGPAQGSQFAGSEWRAYFKSHGIEAWLLPMRNVCYWPKADLGTDGHALSGTVL